MVRRDGLRTVVENATLSSESLRFSSSGFAARGRDVWGDGTPSRTCRILGIIEYDGGTRATTKIVLEVLVRAAHPHGSDASLRLHHSGDRGGTSASEDCNIPFGEPVIRV
jgi:hypothetical protein